MNDFIIILYELTHFIKAKKNCKGKSLKRPNQLKNQYDIPSEMSDPTSSPLAMFEFLVVLTFMPNIIVAPILRGRYKTYVHMSTRKT